jgi:GNAT superfamily N-acetyltransferase
MSSPAPIALTFRVAEDEDVPSLDKLIRSAYRGDASRTGWTTEADLVAGDRIDGEGILAKMRDPDGAVLVGHDADGRLAACCEVLRRKNEAGDAKPLGYFGLFAVDPLRQAGGFGRQMLAEAERYARDSLGVARLEMTVIWTREELISWYVRRGYTRLQETRPFPHEEIARTNGKALRDDLHFAVLIKDL